jgi:hypothetical protein
MRKAEIRCDVTYPGRLYMSFAVVTITNGSKAEFESVSMPQNQRHVVQI